ncbi:MAG: SDR family NAD(P)-dependent oxidoreductase [Verrucomicrobia bacterium]|nr:SDR family NAD(P)-dependent oxidoreductase [Verrucomicrobiota bacterium]
MSGIAGGSRAVGSVVEREVGDGDESRVDHGSGGGLGRGLVAAFADAGWQVAAGYHLQPPPASHDRVWPLPLDVTAKEAPTRVVEEVVARWGRLDVLINNAGVIADGLVTGLDEAAWDRVIGVNLTGAMACARAAVWPMIRQRDGHIVNLGSFAARRGPRGQANYAAAKAGLIGLTQSLAAEMGSRNLRVNAVLPGGVAYGDDGRAGGEGVGRVGGGEPAAAGQHRRGSGTLRGLFMQLEACVGSGLPTRQPAGAVDVAAAGRRFPRRGGVSDGGMGTALFSPR